MEKGKEVLKSREFLKVFRCKGEKVVLDERRSS